MSLLDSFKIELSEFHSARVRLIDKADFSGVARKANEELGGVTPRYLNEGIENLKRYYAVALLDPLNRHAVSKAVDPFWHAHVLFTRNYADFCRGTYGHFIHHEPLDDKDTKKVEHVVRLYGYTKGVYEGLFRSVDPDWWPPVGGPAFQPVCLHQLITNEEVLKNALFPKKPELMKDVDPEEYEQPTR